MKRLSMYALVAALFVGTACQKEEKVAPVADNAQVKAAWTSSDKWGSWSNGGYTVRNNVWGGGAGAQSIWANSYSQWGVWANHPTTGGIKSYPHSAKDINKRVSAIGSLGTSFNVTRPSSGSYITAYDIWLDNHAHEIMLWMNKTGSVGPISYSYDANGAVPVYRNLSVGGHTWNVYRGSNGSNQVYSFIRTSNTNSGSIDLKAILNWIKNTPKWFGDSMVQDVQFGYEITSSSGGLNFTTNSYSVY